MRSPLHRIQFNRPTIILWMGLAIVATLAWLGHNLAQQTLIAATTVCLLAVALDVWRRIAAISEDTELLTTPMALAQDHQILDLYRSTSRSLRDISAHFDPIFRDLAISRVQELEQELSSISRGHIVFYGTETWRRAYEQLLRSRGLYLYRSVAHLKTADYWQNEPGRQSMRLNHELSGEGSLRVERIAIIPDPFWPHGEVFPIEPIATWLDDQHQSGIAIKVVRLSDLSGEDDLIADFGIYGNRAVGDQQINDQGSTVRFTLSFDFAKVLAAEQRWERLFVYARSYGDLRSLG